MNIRRVILSAAFAFSLLASALADTHYVAMAGQTPVEPYTNDWPSAASNIQAAVDASTAGDTVLVGAGVYDTGATNYYGSNRVYISKAIVVRSANNDPATTIIKGEWDPATTNGPAAVRCVGMAQGSSLIGFTLTNGATANTYWADSGGGGVHCLNSRNAIVSNCVLTGCSAGGKGGSGGGGAYCCTLYNCTLSGNSCMHYLTYYPTGCAANSSDLYNCLIVSNWSTSYGGAVMACPIVSNCTLVGNTGAGGAYQCTRLYNCALIGNSGNVGAYQCTLYNCLLVGNISGGSSGSTLYNCTVVRNSGSGVSGGSAINCIVYSNSPNNWANTTSIFTNSCTFPTQTTWVAGDGNITNNPAFIDSGSGYGTNYVAGNYRLSPVSPCVNTGTNFAWMTNAFDGYSRDLDGQMRVRYGRVDMGCYEFIFKGSVLSFR